MDQREKIIDAIKRDELVVVAGTGVSAGLAGEAEVCTWVGLLRNGIAHLRDVDPDLGALLEMRLDARKDPADLTGIAQDLKRAMGADFGRWIAQTIGELRVTNAALAEAIKALGVPILTTNYDTLLEEALGLPSAAWGNPSQMRDLLLRRHHAIGHLHGVWSDPSGLVFSSSDYDRVTADSGAQDIQRSAFTMKTFLFVGVGHGLDDPNFGPMVTAFERHFGAASATHYRLCREAEADVGTKYSGVVDVSFGSDHAQLVDFLNAIAVDSKVAGGSSLRAQSRNHLLDILREKSTMWRDTDAINEKSLADLVVDPVFLPEPHDQYATSAVIGPERDKPQPIAIDAELRPGAIVVVAGEENSGVSTAVIWALARAMEADADLHAVFVDKPMTAGKDPVNRQVGQIYRSWGVDDEAAKLSERGILGIDNIRFEEGDRFERAIRGIASAPHRTKVLGVREADAPAITSALREASGSDVSLVYLGRFSSGEVRELARRVAPGREDQVTRVVMVIIREKNLPRTPFTATLLVELVQSGVKLKRGESEIAVLDQYVDLLLSPDFFRSRETLQMTVRNKRLVLELLARHFVVLREDRAPQGQIIDWLSGQFSELGWSFDALACVNDLIDRRVLARGPESTIKFQRSAYLELMAGIAAKDDETFRKLVFGSPLQLASIVRTYAAMARNDSAVLGVIDKELDRIAVRPVSGTVFASVRQIAVEGDEVFKSRRGSGAEAEESTAGADSDLDREGSSGVEKPNEVYYDDSPDADAPAFLTARLEELPDARIAMLVVDLASRVLRDSDEVRDQALKERILRKVLVAWVRFTDLYEADMSEWEDLDDAVANFFPGQELSSDELEAFRRVLLMLYPSVLTASGIRHCLSAPSLVTRLRELDLSKNELGSLASLMRTVALYMSGSTEWVETLRHIDEVALNSFFATSFMSGLARYAYIVDDRLTDEHRNRLREFLRRVVTVRYRFSDPEHRNRALNKFEDSLRRAALQEGKKFRDITIEA